MTDHLYERRNMQDINDFCKKQMIVFSPSRGDKISYKNDNIIIKDSEGTTKYQISCYRIFALIVIGDCSITTGIIRRAKKFGFSICFMTYTFRFYSVLNSGLVGNTYLHQKQYAYEGNELARMIIYNKISNQRKTLCLIRKKTPEIKEGIILLDNYLKRLLQEEEMPRDVIMGIEGNAAKVYFPRVFNIVQWTSRRPRVKSDYLNSLLDIGYTLLFNFIDCILQVYDFDVYKGVLHTCFYMRKSLVCDLMEPFRPIVEWRVRKGISLNQFKQEDFVLMKGQWQLEYKKSSSYAEIFMQDILEHKEGIFLYIRSYYRAFMKNKSADQFPQFDVLSSKCVTLQEEKNFDYS